MCCVAAGAPCWAGASGGRTRRSVVTFLIVTYTNPQPSQPLSSDPSGNALEFKAMTTPSNLFAKYVVNE